jgi:diketogulonate reductase-like aldo/keto reductase
LLAWFAYLRYRTDFDSFTVHFPIALEYVDPEERYPPGWFGPDGKTVRLQNTPMQETWEAMESLVDDRLVEKIGIRYVCHLTVRFKTDIYRSHCPGALLLDILRYARIQPTVLEVELHPYLTQHRLVALAERLKMTITAYMYLGPNDELLTDETITSIAKRLNVCVYISLPSRITLTACASSRGSSTVLGNHTQNLSDHHVENSSAKS